MAPQLASWDAAGSASQVRLAEFLAHLQAAAMPMLTHVAGPYVVELTVGLSPRVPLTSGGRDLDNYLYPLAQRLGPQHLAAAFGRKVHGLSWFSAGPAQPEAAATPALFTTRMTGSYARTEWKAALRQRLLQARATPAPPGPVTMHITITTGPGRSWPNLWKPLLDAFGPVLGEDPAQPFHPHDDRITELGLHHNTRPDLGHDVLIEAWWNTSSMHQEPSAAAPESVDIHPQTRAVSFVRRLRTHLGRGPGWK
jgi:hypothetical protein